MNKYFPHSEQDIALMLAKIGVSDLKDLFKDVPKNVMHNNAFNLPKQLSEIEIREEMTKIADQNQKLVSFLGAGSYDVYTPSVISALTSRQEFLTSYTPYQPEISQGNLQYIFEFQSMICELTGLDVSNASVYDGATATAEAMFMAVAQTKREKVLISETLNPNILNVLKTYAYFRNVELITIPMKDYMLSKQELTNLLDDGIAGVVVQNPNYFGLIEDYADIADLIHENKSLLIANVDPSTLSVLKTPKEMGVDIACGDGQTLGIPISFGGPYVGFMATTEKLLRKMPGRICGMTNDIDGKRGFVLTLQAREQHIRREKANSNICSNQSLMALHTVIYMSLLGKNGLHEVAMRAYHHAHYLRKQLLSTKIFESNNNQPFFKEFVLKAKVDPSKLNEYLLGKGYLSGLDLGNNMMLFCATEMRTKAQIDDFVKKVEEFANVR
ncbi:MAG: aminomethyl-transferring glycine dehydrogenase subunit GcvPA [Bacilli bacterium]